jgi:predicted SnoaL-like aldol condensation-catalyzing enzyme
MSDQRTLAREADERDRAADHEELHHRHDPDLEANKAVALRFIERVFVDQDPNAVDELAAEDFTAHTFGDLPPGREPLKLAMKRAGEGVSDATFEINDVIAEKDRVAVRLTTRARHTGTFMGMEPSGNEYSLDEIHIFRVADGKVLEHWHEFDKARLMQQLQQRSRAAGAPQRGKPEQGKPQGGETQEGRPVARPAINARS